MSLLSVNIAHTKRLSVKEVVLQISKKNENLEFQEIHNSQILLLAKTILKERFSYNKEYIIAEIQKITSNNKGWAEEAFFLMIEIEAIEKINQPESYYLGGSTPF